MNHENVYENLPDDWKVVPFSEVMDIQGGSQPAKKFFKSEPQEGYIRLLQIRDFGKKPVPTFVPKDLVTKFCKKDDIFIARYGASLGRILTGMEGAYNVALAKVLYERDFFDKGYLFYLLKTPIFQTPIKMISRSAQNGFNKDDLRPIKIPIAPLEQQKRIVAKIEELFSHIDAGIEALNKAKQLLKQYRQSVLKAAVTGELLGYKFSEEMFKPIDFGLETLGQGWSPRCEKEPSPSEDTWGVIKTTAVQSLEYRQEENKRLPDSLEPRPKHEILVGDLLVTRAGPRVRVGICCLVKETRKKLMICDKVYRLRVKKGVILPEYLAIILNAPNVLIEVEKLKSGINDSGVNLTQNKFIQLQIPYPLIEDQKSLTQIVTDKVDSISRLDEDIEKQMLKAEKNKQSVLASAFSGQLL